MDELQLKNIVQFNSNGLLSATDTIEKALVTMSEHNISSVVITTDTNIPVGIFTEYDSLNIIANNKSLKTQLSEVMSKGILTVKTSKYLHDAYVILSEAHYRHLIVVDDEGKYVGIISEGDFLRYMSIEYINKVEVVEQVMDKTPLIIGHSALVQDVAKLMSDKYVDYAIVTKGSKPIGIVDERKIAHHFIQKNNNCAVEQLISKQVHSISKSVLVQDAATLLTTHGIHQLIVTDEKQNIIGLLKRNDVLKTIHGSYFEFLINSIERKSLALSKLIDEQKIFTEKTNLLDTVINTIPDLVWVKDINGKYVTCNKMFEHLYNASRSEIIGRDDFDFVPKNLAKFFQEHDNNAIEKGHTVTNEEYLVFKDGSYEGTFETIKTPIKDINGSIFGVLGIARDISERKNREEELQRIDNELKAAEELAHVGSWTWDIKNNVFSGSEEALRIYGANGLQEGGIEILLEKEHPDDREMVESALKNAMMSGQYNLIHRLLIDGETKWVSVSAKFFKDEFGNYTKAQGMLQDITQQKLYELELERLANYDPLTGLANRTFLITHLSKLINRNIRNKNNSAILLFDIDHFRDINDSFGHNIGDELLIQVAKRFEHNIRQEDLASHISGDEFIVVLEHLSTKEDVAHVAQEMIQKLSEPYMLSQNIEVRISVSIGIVFISENIKTGNELLQFADVALYQAKNEGRNCYRFYTNELTLLVQERIKYQNEIFHALQNNEFELYYQPQIHIETNRIIGAEALIRWNHPQNGIVNPTVFIPIAEESGLIARIGEWTLQEACKQGKIWQDRGYDFHLSVNVAMPQLRHHNLVKVVQNVLNQSHFSPEKLILELTESAMMKHEDELAEMLHILRAKGIGIAIDDFGTGYSSYSYLKRFPIDILKIDKSFIDDIPYKKDASAIVKAIISMSEILGYQILAEGVEYKEQADFLREQKCHYYQGFLKSKPLKANEFEALLKSQNH